MKRKKATTTKDDEALTRALSQIEQEQKRVTIQRERARLVVT